MSRNRNQTDKLELEDYDTGDMVTLPSKFEVCDRCRGTGVHDHPAFSNGISQDQFDEDPDFREEYMRGTYDVQCEECAGRRVVLLPDLAHCTPEQVALWNTHCEARAEAAAERRMRERGIQF